MSKNKKTNPRSIPRSQADCDKQWRIGCIEGIRLMEAIFLRVLIDKHSDEVDVSKVWGELTSYTETWAKGKLTPADIRNSLKEEDKIMLISGPSSALLNERERETNNAN
jgi:hypothetical protein